AIDCGCELLIVIKCLSRSLQQRIGPSLRSNLRVNGGNGKCECQQHREQSVRVHEGSPGNRVYYLAPLRAHPHIATCRSVLQPESALAKWVFQHHASRLNRCRKLTILITS